MTTALDDAIARAERAATELTEARDAGSDDGNLALRCAAAGLTLLAELGATMLGSYESDWVAVSFRDVEAARRILAPHASMLQCLGWYIVQPDGPFEPLYVVRYS